MLITCEGIEGSGKSTHVRTLVIALRAKGVPAVLVAEPGGTPLSEGIRRLLLAPGAIVPFAELLLFLASRAQLVTHVIKPALARGDVVLCDRYSDSTMAYQGYGRGLPLPRIRRLNRWATGGIRPFLTLLLDVDVGKGLARTARKKRDRIELEARTFHERVRRGFLAIARRQPGRVRVVRTGTLADVQRRIQRIVFDALVRRGIMP